ncbi:amino acid ABC transporter membrane protein 1 (PAAT family) [Hoeflea marina]|uniref:Amino acid ABC transporter membrane protein 1 (PAAT family) n=1 Tax=Hoeflea marina TaxID=274592 RepID=A0A317PP02_9HYPH|nr:ABC transporter permease subunit [Hoeflea marina]PWW01939.1 amino acid ABC transporter membrane protein 1 (PAAT family) [Hoeflea marina]
MTGFSWFSALAYGDTGWGDEFVRGALFTLSISVCSYCLGIVLGLFGATAKLSRSRPARAMATFYTTAVRAVPELLLILLIYYSSTSALRDLVVGLGLARDFQVNGFVAACLSLGVVQGAYSTEVFRGAIIAVGKEQVEAATALGLSRRQTWRLVVFPQMLHKAIPGLGNLWLVVLKESSLISVVGFSELLLTAKMAGGAENRYLFFFSAVAFAYLGLSVVSSHLFDLVERQTGRHERGHG